MSFVLEDCVAGVGDGGVGKVLNWDRVDIVGVVIVRHLIVLVFFGGLDREDAGCVFLEGSLVLVDKRCKAKKRCLPLPLLGSHVPPLGCVVYFCCIFIFNYRILSNILAVLLMFGCAPDDRLWSLHVTL